MIKDMYVDPLQESMEIKMYDEAWKGHDIAPVSRYTVGLESAIGYAAEIERSYNALFEQVGIAQMKYYVENHEMLTMASVMEAEGSDTTAVANSGPSELALAKKKNFAVKLIEGAIRILQTIAEKIRAAFNWVKGKITESAAGNKAFVAKYGKNLEAISGDITVSGGYTFPGFEKKRPSFSTAGLETAAPKNAEEAEGIRAGWRKNAYQGLSADAYTANTADYAKAVKEAIYGVKGDTKANVKDMLQIIKEGSNYVKMVSATYTTADKTINGLIKSVKKMGKGDPNGEQKIALYKNVGNDMQAVCNVYSKAIVDRVRQAKAVCIKALSNLKANEKQAAKQEKMDAKSGEKISKQQQKQNESADLRSLTIEDILGASI